MIDIWYTDKDGQPADFGLGDRWIKEPFDNCHFKRDKRQKLKLIGELICDAATSALSHSTLAKYLHQALVSGQLVASGRFQAIPLDEDIEAIELTDRFYIPREEFLPLYNSDNYQKCTVGHEDDRKAYFNEWCQFEWMESSLNYFAWGHDTDDHITWQRWTCRWLSIMVHPDQAYRALAKAAPSFSRYIRPGYNYPTKTKEQILAKADEMRARGITRATDIARDIKHEEGFEHLTNRNVRNILEGKD